MFENATDFAHIHYLHDDTFGNSDKPEIRDMHVTTDAWAVTANFKLHNKPVNALWEWSSVPQVEVCWLMSIHPLPWHIATHHHHHHGHDACMFYPYAYLTPPATPTNTQVTAKAFLPSTSVITFTLGNGLSFTTFVNTVPVNANKTVNRFCLVRNISWDKTGLFNADAWDEFARQAMLRILGEDKVMVEELRPDLLVREISVKVVFWGGGCDGWFGVICGLYFG